MMVTARRLAEGEDEIRYEFGLDRQFDRVLVINKQNWEVSPDDGNFDSAAGMIAGKIKKAWRENGEFPQGAIFAS
jgi:hypothetical protein